MVVGCHDVGPVVVGLDVGRSPLLGVDDVAINVVTPDEAGRDVVRLYILYLVVFGKDEDVLEMVRANVVVFSSSKIVLTLIE